MINRRHFNTALAAFGASTMLTVNPGRAQNVQAVRLGNASGIIDAQLIFMTVGQHPELNFYRDEGVEMDIMNMTGAGQTLQAVVNGHAETSAVSPVALLPVYANNPDLDILFPYCWLRQPHWSVAVKPDSPLQSLEELRGKNIGIRNQGDTGYFGARAMLREIGIDPDNDVEWTAISEGGPAGEAIYRERVDAMAFWDGGFARVEIAGFPLRHLPNSPGMQQLFGNGYAVRRSTFADNRDVFTRFFRAMAKSTVFAYAASELSIRMHWDIYPESKPTGLSDEEALASALHIVNARRDKWLPGAWQQDRRFGAMSEEEWQAQVRFAELEDQITDVSPLFTTEILDDVNDFDHDEVLAHVARLNG